MKSIIKLYGSMSRALKLPSNHRFNLLLPITFAVFVSISCENYLEPEKNNDLTIEEILKLPKYWEGVLFNAYRAFPAFNYNADFLSDDAVALRGSGDITKQATGFMTPSDYTLSRWSTVYGNVHYINLFLEHYQEVEWSSQSAERTELYKRKYTGEAHALRAYMYFTLLQAHGGMSESGELLGFPILTETAAPTKDKSKYFKRNTYEECVTQILSDCDTAIKYLPEYWKDLDSENSSDLDYNVNFNNVLGVRNTGRVDGRAIIALKSRLLLYAASPAFNPTNDQNKWQISAEAAAEAMKINNGLNNLSPDNLTWYDIQNEDYEIGTVVPEIFWRTAYNPYANQARNNYPPSLRGGGEVNPTQNLVDAFPMANGYPIDHNSSGYNAASPYENRDPRLAKYIVYEGNTIHGDTIKPLSSSVDGIGSQTSTRSGYYMKKMINEETELNVIIGEFIPSQFQTLFRYTEMLLNYAEAVNELNGPEHNVAGQPTARQVMEAIRERAGLPQPDSYLSSLTSKDEFREFIKNERRIELCFENHRFWDLRRWNDLNEIKESVHGARFNEGTIEFFEIEPRNYPSVYCPIPYEEILKYNEGELKQNKGWSN